MSGPKGDVKDDPRSNGWYLVSHRSIVFLSLTQSYLLLAFSYHVFYVFVCPQFIRLTNDGNAILREIDVAHPAAKNMIELSRTQDEECGDGTTSVIILGLPISVPPFIPSLTSDRSWGNPRSIAVPTRTRHSPRRNHLRIQ